MTQDTQTNQLPRMKQFYLDTVVPTLMKEEHFKNKFQVPTIQKIVINMGVTQPQEVGAREQAIKSIVEQFRTIAGQQPQVTKAKKAIAGFKLRAGDPVGVMVTLRGRLMWEFLDRLISLTLPRVKDFQGVSRTSFDDQGHYSLGLEEQIVFPEIEYDKIERIRGLQINISVNAEKKEHSFRLLELLGMPFAKEKTE